MTLRMKKMLRSTLALLVSGAGLVACSNGTTLPDAAMDTSMGTDVVVDTGVDGGGDEAAIDAAPDVTESPEFAAALAVFTSQTNGCALPGTGCHGSAGTAGELRLTAAVAYASIVGQPSVEVPTQTLVVPGDPTHSYLMQKVDGTFGTLAACMSAVNPCGVQMPAPPASPLQQSQIDTIRAWIMAGAPR